MTNEIMGFRTHNNYEERYGCMQYLEDGQWKDTGSRWELSEHDVMYVQSELPKLDAEIRDLESQLEYLMFERNEIAKDLGLEEI